MREAIAEFTFAAYAFLVPISLLALFIGIIVLLPLAISRRTREAGGIGMIIVSYIVGITTWLLGCAVTFTAYGWLGLIVGIFLLGVGVVPLAMIAAIFKFKIWGLALTLLVMSIITLGAHIAGAYCVGHSDRD